MRYDTKHHRKLAKRGKRVGPDQPELAFHLVYIWEAYHALHNRRPQGLGIHPIPYTEINAFMDIYGIIKTNARRDMVDMIVKLDMVSVTFAEEKGRKQDEDQKRNDSLSEKSQKDQGKKRWAPRKKKQ